MSQKFSMHYQNRQYSRVMQLKYKSKYKKLKQRIKNYVLENAALCDEVADVQGELAIAREERRFLIRRLMRHEGMDNLDRLEIDATAAGTASQQQQQTQDSKPIQFRKKRGPKKRISTFNGNEESAGIVTSTTKEQMEKQRIKVGKPIFPINLGNILIHTPGEILPSNTNFHKTHWIYPVGYAATRIYAHPKEPKKKCVYTCKILNNAGIPQFQVIPDNDLDSVFFGETANSCHQALLETLQRSLSCVKQPLQVQGERFFGLGHNTVKTLLQMDSGFNECINFKGFEQQQFNDTTAGKLPALPDDQDPSLSFDALQAFIAMATYHSLPEVKDEPPDELFDFK